VWSNNVTTGKIDVFLLLPVRTTRFSADNNVQKPALAFTMANLCWNYIL